MIALLLLSFTSWCRNKDTITPLRGRYYNDSLMYVNVPLNYIKKANVKLIERKFYIKLNNQKDSIINFKNQYINTQSIMIDQLSKDFKDAQNVNQNIQKDLERQKNKTKLILYTGLGAISILLLTTLIR